MEANSPSVRFIHGDFAAGVRTTSDRLDARGDFATGMRMSAKTPARHHGDFAAGPGVLGKILRGLADAVARARLREHQRELRRVKKRARGRSDAPVSNEWERKSVGGQETFERDTLEPVFILDRAHAFFVIA